ncbi:MAG: toll/interleukin-1 receptor domain-containing protein [Deltaproteobacteria bacterium]|nr:toll/interleukin-1 receptor domain-containing protein [Deltaproteobacteria bacterium]
MSNLSVASDVVCLLTDRSLNRPWLLYEAGVAKGKLDTPVHGIALGVPLDKVGVGPFYQFQNCDGNDKDSLSTLVRQLCERVPGLAPDDEVVMSQVGIFTSKADGVLKSLGGSKKTDKKDSVEDGAVAKVVEEMKILVRDLSMRFEHQLAEGPNRLRQRRLRRFHPGMFEEMLHMSQGASSSPIGILIIASLVRDDIPWLYELGVEAYRILKSGKSSAAFEAARAFRDATEMAVRGPYMDEMGFLSKEARLMLRELPIMIEHCLQDFFGNSSRHQLRLDKAPKKE